MSNASNRPLNVSYLVVGLIFLGISGSWALHAGGVVDTGDVQWLAPLVLVGAGAIGLIAFTAKGLTRGRNDRPSQEPGADAGFDPYPEEPDQIEETDPVDETQQTEQTTRIEGDDR